MATNKAVFDYLTEGDNLAVAMEMAEFIEQLQLDMHKRFWSTYNAYMAQKIKASEYGATWRLQPYNTNRIRTDWEKSFIHPIVDKDSKQSYLQFVFAQGTKEGKYQLFWGLHWNVLPIHTNSASLVTLQALLMEKNIRISEPPWWIYWGFTKHLLYSPEFLVRMYKDTDAVVSEIVNDVWGLFLELRPLMDRVTSEVNSGGFN